MARSKYMRISSAYYESIRLLRKKCPLIGGPVKTRRVSVVDTENPNDLASALYIPKKGNKGAYFLIKVKNTLSGDRAIEALVHEWAHAMVWFLTAAEQDEGDHHSEWGVAYARCYRAVFEDS